MRHISLLHFVPLFLCFIAFSTPALAQGGKSNRVVCGGYSFTLPEGYNARIVQADAENFLKELILNDPYSDKDSEAATVLCLRERKTEFSEYVLNAKQAVKLRTGPRQTVSLTITATEDITRAGMRFKYSILEEKPGNNRREIRGIHYYVPVIEISGQGEEHHTLLFIKDFRKTGDYYNMEGYISAVNRTADRVLRSIKRVSL